MKELFVKPYPLHRFPKKMAKIFGAIQTIDPTFGGDVRKVFTGKEEEVIDHLMQLSGIEKRNPARH